jgi:hypothetical protein
MTVAELGTIIGVLFAIGGMVWKVSAAIAAMESRLNASINQLRIEAVTRKDLEMMRRRSRAVEGFLVKHFSVDLDRYEMD